MADAKATFALVGEDQTAAAFKSAISNVQAFAEQAQTLLEGAFAIGGANIAADFIKKYTELGDSLVKGAERAGIAQAQFNQLAAAFGEADISIDSLSRGIKNLEVAISKAADGDKDLTKAFNEFGLSAASLKQLAPDVQLLAIAEATSRIIDPADRARLGAATMGKQFLELEPVLLKGAEGMDAFVKAAHGLDAMTAENLAKYNEQLNKTGEFFKGWAAWNIDGLFQKIKAFGDFFSPDLEARIARIKTALASPDNFDPSTVERMMKELTALQAQSDALAAKQPGANVVTAVGEQGKGNLEAIAATLAEIDKNWTALTEKWAKQRSDQLDQEDKDTRTRGEKRVDFEAKVDDLVSAGRINAYDAIKRIYDQDEKASNAHADEVAKAANSGAIHAAIEEQRKDWQEASDSVAAQNKLTTERMAEDWNKTKENAKSAAQSMEDSFATFLVDPFSGGLKKMLSAWVQTIDQMVAKAAAQSIFKSLFGDSGLAGVFQGFLTGSAPSYAGVDPEIFGGGSIPGHATGGSWRVGGEGGPDSQLVRFKATPGEQVTVNTPGQSAGGAPAIHFAPTYNIGSGVSRTDVIQACAATQNATIARMTELINGGAYRR